MSSVPTDQGNVLPVLIMLFQVIFGTSSFAASTFTMYDLLYILTNFSEAVDYFYIYRYVCYLEGPERNFSLWSVDER